MLLVFVIGGHTLNNKRYADSTVLIEETKRMLQQLLQNIVKEREKYRLKCNGIKREYMDVSKRNCPTCRLQNGIKKIKGVNQFKYLGNLLREERMVTLKSEDFKNKLRNMKISLTKKKKEKRTELQRKINLS